MKTHLLSAVVASLCLSSVSVSVADPLRYSVVDKLSGPDGGYDYVSVDTAAQRVFIAREYGVLAIDIKERKVIPKLLDGKDVSAVLLIPNSDLLLTTNWAGNTATLSNRHTGAKRAEIKTGQEPDAAVFEPTSGRAFVMNGKSHDITVIDVAKGAAVGSISLKGKPEAGVADGKGRLYVNIEDTAEVAVIDVSTLKVQQHYTLTGCVEPTGIAFDAVSGSLLSACHNGVAVVLDAATGKHRGTVKVGADADGAIFDSARRLAFIPCDDGTLTIFRVDERGATHDVMNVKTTPGARTAALEPTSGRLYLPATDSTKDAAGEKVRTPGTFRVLVVAPQ